MERGEPLEKSPEQPDAVAPRLLSNLTAEERSQALERYQIIRPFLEEGVSLEQISSQRKQTARTLRRWVRCYQQEGLVGLARRERHDAGKRRRLSTCPQKWG